MALLEPVLWAKGTILKPQHLQSQDRYFEESLNFQLRALNFRPWGFSSLRIDQEQLAAGIFAIHEASGILPDGLLFDMPGPDLAPPPRPLEFEPDQQTLDVYLSIPQYRQGGLNVASTRREVDARFCAEVEMFRDENTGQSEKPVLVAHKNFRILLEGENLEGAASLRAAVVRKTEAGVFELDPHFIPPSLDLLASNYLISIVRRLVEILTAKANLLAGARRQKNQSLADFTSSDIASFWLLYTINTAQPLFRHIFETRAGHPERLYSAMLALAGSLSTFSLKIQPRDLPTYDHNDLGARFTDLDDKLRYLLETVVPSNFVSLPLKQVHPSIYATSIDHDDYLKGTKMYLAVNAETPAATLISRAPSLIKLSSADAIDHLVQSALPGVPLTWVSTPPAAIPVKLNFQYFSLEQSGGPWEALKRARNLAAWVPSDFPNPEMELIILLPESQ
jgi:type VI secretion system protein ImpJ